MTPILSEEPNTHRSFDAQKPKYRARREEYEAYTEIARRWLELELLPVLSESESKWKSKHAGRIKKLEAQIGLFDPAELDEIWKALLSKKNCADNSLGRQILRP